MIKISTSNKTFRRWSGAKNSEPRQPSEHWRSIVQMTSIKYLRPTRRHG